MKSQKIYLTIISMLIFVSGCLLVGHSDADLQAVTQRLEKVEQERRDAEKMLSDAKESASAATAAGDTDAAARFNALAADLEGRISGLSKVAAIIETEKETMKREAGQSDNINSIIGVIAGLAGVGGLNEIWKRARMYLQESKNKESFAVATIHAVERFREAHPDLKAELKDILQDEHKAAAVADWAKAFVNRVKGA